MGVDYFKSKRVLGSEDPLECSILQLTNISPVKVIVSSWRSYSVWVALEANTDTSVVVSHKQIDNLYHVYAIFQFVVDMRRHEVVKRGLSRQSSRNCSRWQSSTAEGNYHQWMAWLTFKLKNYQHLFRADPAPIERVWGSVTWFITLFLCSG